MRPLASTTPRISHVADRKSDQSKCIRIGNIGATLARVATDTGNGVWTDVVAVAGARQLVHRAWEANAVDHAIQRTCIRVQQRGRRRYAVLVHGLGVSVFGG